MARIPRFKHFNSEDPDALMQEIEDWVNGETDNTDWIAEFHIVIKGSVFHAFVKYLEITE